jgi:hypothetical protein
VFRRQGSSTVNRGVQTSRRLPVNRPPVDSCAFAFRGQPSAAQHHTSHSDSGTSRTRSAEIAIMHQHCHHCQIHAMGACSITCDGPMVNGQCTRPETCQSANMHKQSWHVEHHALPWLPHLKFVYSRRSSACKLTCQPLFICFEKHHSWMPHAGHCHVLLAIATYRPKKHSEVTVP